MAVAAGAPRRRSGRSPAASGSSPNGSLYWSSPAPCAKAEEGASAIAVAAMCEGVLQRHRRASVDRCIGYGSPSRWPTFCC